MRGTSRSSQAPEQALVTSYVRSPKASTSTSKPPLDLSNKLCNEALTNTNGCDTVCQVDSLSTMLQSHYKNQLKVGPILSMSVTAQQLNNEPDVLARTCAEMIEFISQSRILKRAYRIELRRASDHDNDNDNDHKWSLELKLNTLAWFDYLAEGHTRKGLLAIAVRYTRSVKRKILELPPEEPQTMATIQIPHTCFFWSSCDNSCNKRHPTVQCGASIERTAGGSRRCNWGINGSLLLSDPKNAYVLGARMKPIRDILLCPTQHVSNEDMVRKPRFWSVVASVMACLAGQCDRDAVEYVAINFGNWESAQSLDPLLTHCHGHAHLIFYRTAIEQLAESYPALRGRTGRPDIYIDADVKDLQMERLREAQIEDIEDQIGELRQEVQANTGQITDLRGEVQANTGQITNLRGEVQANTGQMTDLRKEMAKLTNQITKLLWVSVVGVAVLIAAKKFR